jgi:uncharacterized membrane protein
MNRSLLHFRNLLVALANASVTWIVLIIASLGLFAVIFCTLLVFTGSLASGWLGDLVLTQLLSRRIDELKQPQIRQWLQHQQASRRVDHKLRHPNHRHLPR